MLEYRARRPTVTDNFGNDLGSENYPAALRVFQSDEADAAPLLEALAVRYVVTQRDTAFLARTRRPGRWRSPLSAATARSRDRRRPPPRSSVSDWCTSPSRSS